MGKYKAGDIVKVREDLERGKLYGGRSFNSLMEPVRGKNVKIVSSGECGYWIDGNCKGLCFTDEMFEPADATDTNVVTAITRASILDEAKRCVCGDRDQQYGCPEDSFRAIGNLWAEYLRDKCVDFDGDVYIEPDDVAAMMCLFKIARIKTGVGKADTWVDLAGYAACGGEIQNATE